MDKKKVAMIPFVAHESSMNRMERANRRLFIVIIIMFIGMVIYLLLPSEIKDTKQEISNATDSEIHQNIND